MVEEFDNEYSNNSDYDLAYEKLFMPEVYEDFFNYTIGKAFAISNEQLDQVFYKANLKNKSFLTVGSSGDQALNAILCGCKDITIIDANIFTQYFIEYKLAFIKTFNYEAFSNLFIKSEFFDWRIYAKLSHHLSPKVKQFWDTLMLDQTEDCNWGEFGAKTIKENMLFVDHRDRHSLFYKNKKAYNRLQSLLNSETVNLEFVHAEFQNFPKVLKKKYHFINLSNIYDYYSHNMPLFVETVNKLYFDFLYNNGRILAHYDFNSADAFGPLIHFGEHQITCQEIERASYRTKKTDLAWYINKQKTSQKNNDDKQK